MNAKDPQLEQHLKTLRLSAFIDEYQRAADSCATANRSYTQYLSVLAEQEVNQRTQRAIERRIAAAKFPQLKTLDTFDFAAQPSVKKQQILQLAECHFIAEKTNLIFLGPCGTGKTHLSIALGHLACVKGYKVYFDTAAGLINTLIEAKNEYRLSKKMKQLMRFDLLICDELGYIPFDREGTDLLFQLVASRYEHGTTIVTTNLPFSQWTKVFHEEATAVLVRSYRTAVIDRLVHHSVIIQIQGQSYRLAAKVTENS
jgi:DNA replication protein DnaC